MGTEATSHSLLTLSLLDSLQLNGTQMPELYRELR